MSAHHVPVLMRRLATAATLFLTGAVLAQVPNLSVDQASYDVGQDIVVTYAQGPGNATDWIGIYPADAVPGETDSTLWSYVEAANPSQGAVTFTGGLGRSGDWVAYLLENDGYTILAQVAFTVIAPATGPRVYSLHSAYTPEEPIEIGWANGPGNRLDWIGVYPQGIVPGDVPSTLWLYVDGTQTGSTGLREGTVTFTGGLVLADDYEVHLLENDGYNVLASAGFSIVGPFDPLLRSNQRFYQSGESITLTFSNGFGWTKDWIGLYPAGVLPGDEDSLDWLYLDGTQSGNTALWDGSVTFDNGLAEPGDYIAYWLENDTYFALAHERITILPEGGTGPRLLVIEPPDGALDVHPSIEFHAVFAQGTAQVDPATVSLTLDGNPVTPQVTPVADTVEIDFTAPDLFAPGSTHEFILSYQDDAVPPADYQHTTRFTVRDYRNIVLPAPLVFEDFDTVAEGALPAGWTQQSYSEITNPDEDLTNLDSATYGRWVAVDASRFAGPLTPYSDFGNETEDYQRVLTPNPANIVDGQVFDAPLAEGRLLFGNSGYRNGMSQVLYLFTPDFDLTGQTDIHLSFHSLWEQNQDSIGAVEYSIDGGLTWRPVVYLLDGPDIVTFEDPETGATVVDALTTFTTEHDDVARYLDENSQEQGGYYGAFIAAPISQDLAPFISARIDNDPVGSKRVELFRLPAADDQNRVRFRFAHAGADSWYFGIDNFGLYSIPSASEPLTLAIQREGNQIVLSWSADSGAVILEQTPNLASPNWTMVDGVTGHTVTLPATDQAAFYRLRR